MADPLAPRSPFDGLLRDRGAASPGVRVADRHGLGIASVIAYRDTGADLAALVRDRHGIDLPATPRRATADGTAFIGIGEGRWLATGEAGGNRFAAGLATALDGLAAVADQSDGHAVLRLSGPALRRVLAKGVNLDLHPSAFAVGDAAATAIAHIGVVLWRLEDLPDGAPVFESALFRSMAGSFWHWLASSAGEYGLGVEG